MIAFMPLKPEDQKAFVEFFTQEVRIHRDSLSQGPSLHSAVEDTPMRIASAAAQANVTSPPMWKVRKSLPAGDPSGQCRDPQQAPS